MDGSQKFMNSKDKNYHFVNSAIKGRGVRALPTMCKQEFLSYRINYSMMMAFNYLTENSPFADMPRRESASFDRMLTNKYYNLRYRIRKKLKKQ